MEEDLQSHPIKNDRLLWTTTAECDGLFGSYILAKYGISCVGLVKDFAREKGTRIECEQYCKVSKNHLLFFEKRKITGHLHFGSLFPSTRKRVMMIKMLCSLIGNKGRE